MFERTYSNWQDVRFRSLNAPETVPDALSCFQNCILTDNTKSYYHRFSQNSLDRRQLFSPDGNVLYSFQVFDSYQTDDHNRQVALSTTGAALIQHAS
jgi:hypothetical protein